MRVDSWIITWFPKFKQINNSLPITFCVWDFFCVFSYFNLIFVPHKCVQSYEIQSKDQTARDMSNLSSPMKMVLLASDGVYNMIWAARELGGTTQKPDESVKVMSRRVRINVSLKQKPARETILCYSHFERISQIHNGCKQKFSLKRLVSCKRVWCIIIGMHVMLFFRFVSSQPMHTTPIVHRSKHITELYALVSTVQWSIVDWNGFTSITHDKFQKALGIPEPVIINVPFQP